MKQKIKNYLHIELITITFVSIIGIVVLPILYIDNVLFAILYFIILCPLIILVIYNIAAKLYTKINKL